MKYFYYFIILIIIHSNNNSLSQNSWFFQNPYPDVQNINSINFINDNTGFIAGSSGRILKTTDGGLNWLYLNSNTIFTINKIQFINNNTGFIITTNQFLKTTNFGLDWLPKTSLSGDNYNSFSFPSVSLGYICGSSGFLLRTTNSGDNWTQISFKSGGLRNIKFVDSLNGFGFCAFSGYSDTVFKSTDGGISWTFKKFSSGDTIVNFKSLFFPDANTGYALATKQRTTYPYTWLRTEIYKTTNKGINWVSASYIYDYYPFDMSFSSVNNGMITVNNKIYRTNDGATSWVFLTSDSSTNFTSVYYKNANLCLAGGYYGLLSKSTNSGYIWTKISRFFTTKNIITSFFLNSSTGFIAGAEGLFAKTIDGGNNWSVYNSLSNARYTSIYFTSALTGYAIGGNTMSNDTICKTIDGGISWQHQSSNTGAGLYCIQFINSLTGYACGYPGKIIKTINAGLNWTSLPTSVSGDLLSLFFIDQNTGYIVSNIGDVIKTTNGGNSFSYQNFGSSTYFRCVKFVNPNVGFISEASFGYIYKTTNAGLNWSSYSTGSSSQLNYINFIDENTGFTVGNGIYKTTNGGINWFRPFYFSSSGFLWNISILSSNIIYMFGDYGSILKTTNGGSIFIHKIESKISNYYYLFQNYPNPFNPTTNIRYQIVKNSFVTLKIFDILGKEVATLVNGNQNAGTYEVNWNADNYSSGMYFYKIKSDDFSDVKKLVLIK